MATHVLILQVVVESKLAKTDRGIVEAAIGRLTTKELITSGKGFDFPSLIITTKGMQVLNLLVTTEAPEAPPPEEDINSEETAAALLSDKYMALSSFALATWGTVAVPGMVFDHNDIDIPNFNIERLISLRAVRQATIAEANEFEKRFPKSVEEDEKAEQEMRALCFGLAERVAKAESLPDKAALCLELVRELRNCEATLRAILGENAGGATDGSPSKVLAFQVNKERQLRRTSAKCEPLKRTIREIAEPLIVAAEGLDDPQFASTPLANLLEQWNQVYHHNPNPAFQPAEEFLRRLRPKLISRLSRPTAVRVKSDHEKQRDAFLHPPFNPTQHTPAINIQIHNNNTNSNVNTNTVAPVPSEPLKRKGIFAILNAFVSHPIISLVIAGFIFICIYELWGFNLYDPSSSWRHIFHSATQP
jgi:hypothetical protein